MKKLLIVAALIAVSCSTFAVRRVERKPMTPEQIEKLKEVRARQTGGFIELKGHGHLGVYNNVESLVSNESIEAALKQVKDFVRGLNIKLAPVAFSFETAKTAREKDGAGACVYIVDDAKLPMSLVALEDGWGVVNIAPLKTSDKSLFERRVTKQFIRISSIVFSGVKSQYKISPLQSVTSVAELDKTVGDKFGIDTMMAIQQHLPEIGIQRDEMITYYIACQRGIAEAPTNQYQKAIWDKFHTTPKNPMKIEFDPKKGR